MFPARRPPRHLRLRPRARHHDRRRRRRTLLRRLAGLPWAPAAPRSAGPVAGTLHVTLLHSGGVRASYSFLDRVGVGLGERVRQGGQVGTAGDMLHFGARAGDAYFDPAALFAGGAVEVELLPFEVPPGSSPQVEARALIALALSDHGGLRRPRLRDPPRLRPG